jgi:hypothetical protein
MANTNLPVYTRVFSGSVDEDAENWLLKFNAWVNYVNIHNNGNRYGGAMRSALEGQAEGWFDNLPAATKTDVQALNAAFTQRFVNAPVPWHMEHLLSKRKLQKNESLDTYLNDVTRLCRRLQRTPVETRSAFVRGLPPTIQAAVIQHQPNDLNAAVQAARLALEAQAVVEESTATVAASGLDTIITELRTALKEVRAGGVTQPQVNMAGVATYAYSDDYYGRSSMNHHGNGMAQAHQPTSHHGLCSCIGCSGPMSDVYCQRQYGAMASQPQEQGRHGACCEQLLATVSALSSASQGRAQQGDSGALYCQWCNKRGHDARACWNLRDASSSRSAGPPPPPPPPPQRAPPPRRPLPPLRQECLRCGNWHSGQCYLERQQCRRCLQTGHLESRCPMATAQQPPRI